VSRQRAPLLARLFGGLLIVAGIYAVAVGGLAHEPRTAVFGGAGIVLGMWIRRPQ
jgi:hypothetical protein